MHFFFINFHYLTGTTYLNRLQLANCSALTAQIPKNNLEIRI